MDLPPSPLPWICWACRSGRCLACDGWCEHVIVGRVDGLLVLCPALFPRLRRMWEEER